MRHNILFLCTGNSARSILAEATLRAWGGDRFTACSAGSQPTGRVNPFALAQLDAERISHAGLHSKSWDEFNAAGAPRIDVLISVCDSAAAEACPLAFGDFLRSHWGLPDPAVVHGSDQAQAAAFAQAHRLIKTRLSAMLALPAAVWTQQTQLQAALDAIGHLQLDAAHPGNE